jgi:uncharacterized protein YndB with AHSA1/START domain
MEHTASEHTATCDDTTLRLTRTFTAPRERVFRAWTDPDALKQWWIPAAGFAVDAAAVDLRVGGLYRIAMRNPQGEVFYVTGAYREVRAPERLVYTWRWEGTQMDGIGESLVTVDFRSRGRATELQITHERFPDAAVRDRHGSGWAGCLDQLAAQTEAK